METKKQEYKISGTAFYQKPALIIGITGLIATLAGYFIDHSQFFFSYLTAYMFWMTMTLGALFFTLLHHLTSADWSIVLRRILETVMMTLPVMAILFIPILHYNI